MSKLISSLLLLAILYTGIQFHPTHAQDASTTDWVFFTSEEAGNVEIYRMRPDGTAKEDLTNNVGIDGMFLDAPSLILSPDGEWLYFGSERDGIWDIYRMRLDGSDVQNLTNDPETNFFTNWPGDFYWSPDGQWLAYETVLIDDQIDVFIMRPDGSDKRNLTDTLCTEYATQWTADSAYLIVTSNCQGTINLMRVGVDGSDFLPLTNRPAYNFLVDIMPDGLHYIVEWQPRLAEQQSSLIAMPTDGSEEMEFFSGSGSLWVYGVDPSGEWVYLSDTNTDSPHDVIYRVRVDGTALEPLTDAQVTSYNVKWSPDGTWLVYVHQAENQYTQLYRMNADGTEQTQLTHSDIGSSFIGWTPDGGILYAEIGAEERALWVMDADGANAHELVDNLSSPVGALWVRTTE